MNMEKKVNHYCLAWLDLEMTGLNPEHDRILEMAMIITDAHLNVLAQSEILVIHQSDDLLNNMDEWNTQTHGRTGLTERSRASDLDEATAENQMLELLRQWVPEKTTPLCGNSVHQDRRFLLLVFFLAVRRSFPSFTPKTRNYCSYLQTKVRHK